MTRIVTKGRDEWQPRRETVWQRERARGEILPMHEPRRSLLARVLGR